MGESNIRRRNLARITKLLSLVALALLATPFVGSLFSSGNEEPVDQAASGLVLDVGSLAPGDIHRTTWRGTPVWVYRRTELEVTHTRGLDAALADPESLDSQQPPGLDNPLRSEKPEYFVFVPLESKRNCRVHPVASGDAADLHGLPWYGGYAEACYGARFDLAGRIYAETGNPEQRNLTVPPHRFIGDTTLELLP